MLKLLMTVLLFSAGGAAAGAAPGQAYTQKGCFYAVFPAGWTKGDEVLGLSDSEKKIYGMEFTGPASGGLSARISVQYYAPDNPLQRTPQKFIMMHNKPVLPGGLQGRAYGKVTAGRVGNYYARIFERKVFEYVPARSVNAKKVYVYEKFAVLPVKRGYYVLRYYAPMDIAKANLGSYEAVLASFKALLR